MDRIHIDLIIFTIIYVMLCKLDLFLEGSTAIAVSQGLTFFKSLYY